MPEHIATEQPFLFWQRHRPERFDINGVPPGTRYPAEWQGAYFAG